MYQKLKLECRGCGYIWYPNKAKWESNPTAPEPDCPNSECRFYGKGSHPATEPSIWLIKGTVKVS